MRLADLAMRRQLQGGTALEIGDVGGAVDGRRGISSWNGNRSSAGSRVRFGVGPNDQMSTQQESRAVSSDLLVQPPLLDDRVLLTTVCSTFGIIFRQTCTNRSQKGFEVNEEILVCDSQVPVQQEQELFLHQVHLRVGKPESFILVHQRVAGPVLVLRRGVVQVLGRQDQRGQENPVYGAPHSLCYGGQSLLQSGEVDQRAHERWDLHV